MRSASVYNNHSLPNRWIIDENLSLSEQGKSLTGAKFPTFLQSIYNSQMEMNVYMCLKHGTTNRNNCT